MTRFPSGRVYRSGTRDAIGAVRKIEFYQVGSQYKQSVDVRIGYALFNVNPTNGLDETNLSFPDTNNVFQFDIDLFDDATVEKQPVCTIVGCYVEGANVPVSANTDGQWSLRDFHCNGGGIAYPKK